MFRDRFTPRSYERYADSLFSEVAAGYRSKFVLSSDNLLYRAVIGAAVLTGTVDCEGGIQIEVQEKLRYLRPRWLLPANAVELVFYRYNVVLPDGSVIFRYDSPHGHRPVHHVHRFDVPGTGVETITTLRERDVPTLRQVLQEAEDWYYQHTPGTEGTGTRRNPRQR